MELYNQQIIDLRSNSPTYKNEIMPFKECNI